VDDPRCPYSTSLLQAAATAAGVDCKLVVGRTALADWSFGPDGRVLDAEGVPVRSVWKTWSWQTVMDAASDADVAHCVGLLGCGACAAPPPGVTRPGLQHVLLDPRVRVFEPLWTVLPSSKAILPLLWRLNPHHPALLQSTLELTPELVTAGYVSKPMNGRGSRNVELHGKAEASSSGTGAVDVADVAAAPSSAAAAAAMTAPGPALQGEVMFQELCLLPRYDDHFVQVNTCVVRGAYGGTVLRCSKTAVITYDSNIFALRLVPDGYEAPGTAPPRT
jgi:glutathionylspermidine amidase/synthetase